MTSLRQTHTGVLAGAALFAAELIAWVAAPWALLSFSPVAAIASVVVLIGVPTVAGTPGDKNRPPRLPITGKAEIALELGECAVALVAAGFAWSRPASIIAVVVVVIAVVGAIPRWRHLARLPASSSPPAATA